MQQYQKEIFDLASVEDLEKISCRMRWQYFEKLAAFVFEKNGFGVMHNRVISAGGKKRQYDVVAERFGTIFIVECKKWKRASPGEKDIEKHLDRCAFYEEITGEKARPIFVTLKDAAYEINEIPIIPLTRLNSFLNEFSHA